MEMRMAIELMDEHEKGEHVRAWLRQNGSAIVTGVALGLAAIFGWQWWQGSQSEHRVTASIQYHRNLIKNKLKLNICKYHSII
jgi:predicted negative regulator of RcsB-dependent stress response